MASFDQLSDAELAAEIRRRKQANQPKKYRVIEIDEDTLHKMLGMGAEEVDEEDEGEEEEVEEPAAKKPVAKKRGYFA